MFGRKTKELREYVYALERSLEHISNRYWTLDRKYYNLLDHLGLKEQTVREHTNLVGKEEK